MLSRHLLPPWRRRAAAAVACLSAASGSVAAQLTWTQRVNAQAPGASTSYGIAYDAARDRVVLFGGGDPTGLRNDTWEWNGEVWSQRASFSNPSARTTQMVYDAARQRVVLFGGNDASAARNDTWEWDGSTWTQRSPATSPPARGNHMMAYDARRQRVVVFGGQGVAGQLADTWEWDGTNWSAVTVTGPLARSGAAMSFDAGRSRVVMFGGRDQTGAVFRETWEYDGAAWTQRGPATSPMARDSVAMAYDAARGVTVLFGGYVGIYSAETWTWDGSNWTLRSPANAAPGTAQHGMAYDASRQRTLFFGGRRGTSVYASDTQVWDGSTWAAAAVPNGPTARTGNQMVFDAARGVSMMWGGGGANGLLNETYAWVYDGNSWQLRGSTTSGPAPRTAHRLAYDPTGGGFVVMHGGQNGAGATINETWHWTGGNTWIQVSQPANVPARQGHGMAIDRNGTLFVFGGKTGASRRNDTWVRTWNQGFFWNQANTATAPSARDSVAMAYHPASNKIILFGGFDTIYRNDTWELDPNTSQWRQLNPAIVPPARAQHMMTTTSDDRILMVGGVIGSGTTYRDDAWEWDGNNWTQVSSDARTRVADAGLAYDPNRRRAVLFGGGSSGGLVRSHLEAAKPATSSAFGAGCPGTVGVPQIDSEATVRIGGNWPIRLSNARPNSLALLAIGFSNVSWGGTPLPLNLGIVGAPACNMLTSQDVTPALSTNAFGTALLNVPVSPNVTLEGLVVYAQYWVLDLGANPFGMSLTRAVSGRHGTL